MGLVANRAAGANAVVSDTQERFEFAVDPDVDVLPSDRADKMQPFHDGLRVQYGSDGSGLQFRYISPRWPNWVFRTRPASQSGDWLKSCISGPDQDRCGRLIAELCRTEKGVSSALKAEFMVPG